MPRPKGSKNKITTSKRKALEQYRRRVIKAGDRLFNAQISIAEGVQYLFRVERDEEGKQKKAKLVTSQKEITRYLEGDYDKNKEYFYVTTERPDNKAIDSMLDRTFGKATQHVDLEGEKNRYIEPIALQITDEPQI